MTEVCCLHYKQDIQTVKWNDSSLNISLVVGLFTTFHREVIILMSDIQYVCFYHDLSIFSCKVVLIKVNWMMHKYRRKISLVANFSTTLLTNLKLNRSMKLRTTIASASDGIAILTPECDVKNEKQGSLNRKG